MTDDGAQLMYVYTVLRARDAAPEGPPPVSGTAAGVAGAPVRAVRHGGLAALAGPVPRAEFDEAGLRRNLEDMDWLERTARAHQGVVADAAESADVLPLRLATVCRDEEGVRRLLDEGRERFTAALDALTGRVEWGVKVFAETPQAPSPQTAETPSAQTPRAANAPRGGGRPAPPSGSGRAYLRQRSSARQAGERRAARSEACAREVHEELTPLADQHRLHRPQNPKLSGMAADNLLNAAYLVPQERSRAFAERVGDLTAREEGVRIELTGPWAPYSFAEAMTEEPHDTAVRS